MKSLIINAGQLLTMAGAAGPRKGQEMRCVGLVRDGAVLVEGGTIVAAGPRDQVQACEGAGTARLIDAGGRVVLPGFVDSHAHPVFVQPRLGDFEARLKGKSYSQIAAEGGGILSTVAGVRAAGAEELAKGLAYRTERFLECGTTTLEAKSGYGLDLDSELKILRVIKAAAGPLELVATFLGAHAIPAEMSHDRDGYLGEVVSEMIPAVAAEGLASFVDVFCERGYFTAEEARRVFAAGSEAGLGLKIHAEQLSHGGGARLAVEAGAVSADHLDCVDEADIKLLAESRTVACLLPGSNYFLAKPYPPARGLIDAGAAVALATDFNPGSCPCWDMRMILSIACVQMRMTPEEALVAATINGACALGLGQTHGSLEPGRRADLICCEAEDYREIPYYFGAPQIAWTMKNGIVVHSRREYRL